MRTQVVVEGMTCMGCAGNVQRRFENLDGVKTVSVDLASKTVSIESTENISKGTFQDALAETAYKIV